ncbi:MAG: sugar-binding domain-containing protein [Actinomycetaceae bacterium]|nr:sugar-binding domain-containing protein [Actinomycetaceae bacterium]MDU0969664.1 sugar-binding domain-containing protein [Actinomycetaceae bacterium]
MQGHHPDRAHVHLLLRVSQLYYEDGLNQAAIAREVGYSRPTISRLLTEARERGIVTITISHPLQRLIDLEDQLVNRFGLLHARVSEVEPSDDPATVIGGEAADLLASLGRPGTIIALSNGRSIAAAVKCMEPRHWAGSCIAQMIGSVGNGLVVEDSPRVCRMLADRVGADYANMPVPLMLESASLARAMRHEPQVAAALQLAARADIALVGVGAVDDSGVGGPILQPYIDDEMAKAIRAKGAVGHICGHHFDAQGNHIHTSLCDRMIALDPARLRDLPCVIGVAWGEKKVAALRAAIAGRYINTLVTDKATAQALLEDDKAVSET